MMHQHPQIADPVARFRPWDSEETRNLRHRILKARDIAAVRARRSKVTIARTIFWLANELANDWVFVTASDDQLREIADSLVRLFLVAGSLERVEPADA